MNKLKQQWNNGEIVVNGWLQIPHAFSAEIMAKQPWDALTIDMQHGMMEFSETLAMLQVLNYNKPSALVRVPICDPVMIMKVLDAGAEGIICPLVSNKEECEKFVNSCYYPPIGNRSFGPLRAHLLNPNYMQEYEYEILCLAMIENAEGIENIDEILSVERLDGVYIGVNDLGLALNVDQNLDNTDDARGNELGLTQLVLDKVKYIYEKCVEYNKIPCIHSTSAEFSNAMIDIGFKMVTCASDERLISAGAADIIKDIKK